jgi:hypothetical protein
LENSISNHKISAKNQSNQSSIKTTSHHYFTFTLFTILSDNRQPQDPHVIDYVIHLTPPQRCIVGGDFNAKHDTFEPGVQTSHGGGDLAQWSSDSGMDYIGEPGRATQSAGHVIDLSF